MKKRETTSKRRLKSEDDGYEHEIQAHDTFERNRTYVPMHPQLELAHDRPPISAIPLTLTMVNH